MAEINVERVDHTGIRVADPDRAIKFYEMLGFELLTKVTFDPVIIIRNPQDVEINLCLLYTSPSPRDRTRSRMPSSA